MRRVSTSIAKAGLVALVLLSVYPAASLAQRTDGSAFSCRASAVRVTQKLPLPVPALEPIVANAPNAPCVPANAGVLAPTPVGPVTVDVASARTAQTPANLASAVAANGDNATANASVTNPVIALPGLAISANVLTASASYTCQNGAAVPGGSPQVTSLVINGMAQAVPPGSLTITLPGGLGELRLNETVQEPNKITTRALNLSTPAVDIVIAEAIADISGNPCQVPPPPKQCSDGIDNDGDGLIDRLDPGCLSGPGGTYDPNDDSELDTECSDRRDNDGDGQTDANDPGCLSGPGGTYNPLDNSELDTECSDGRDNDGDGKIDFPADRGCTSRADDSERTAPGTARLGSFPASIARLGLNGPCVRSTFAAAVTGRSISRVVFSLDDRKLRTVSSSPFRIRISTGVAGVHRVSARVTFVGDSGTRARTLSFQFRRCPPPARFTG